jgi:hypothetical protein
VKRRFVPIAALSAICLVAAVMLIGGPPFMWLGAALLAGTLAVAGSKNRERLAAWRAKLAEPRTILGVRFSPLQLLAEVACLAVIVAVGTAMLPEAALGDRPVDHDHPVHLFKAWQLRYDFLADGRLWGWSHQWFAGYPAQYLYPIGADLWIIFVQFLSLGLLNLGQAYGVALWLFWVLTGYAVYRFAAVGFGRWVGILAAVLLMSDTGSFRFGGWVYTMEWAVWPQRLSMAFALLAMARVPGLLENTRWRDVGIFSLLLGAALVTHPIQILHFAIVGPVILLAYWLADSERSWAAGGARLVVGYVLGILIACVWLLPFLSVRDQTASYGQLWATTFDLGLDLFELSIFPGTLPLVIGLDLFGAIACVWVRTFHHLLTGMLVFTFLLAGSSTVIAEFHLLELASAFENVQFQRFSMMLKPYWFVAGAYAVVAILSAARHLVGQQYVGQQYVGQQFVGRASDDRDSTASQDGWAGAKLFVGIALPVLMLVPFVVPYAYQFGSTQLRRGLTEASDRPYSADRDALVDWFEQNHSADEQFFRVMLQREYHDHSFADLGTRIGFPLYKTGFTPASNFLYKMESDAPEMLEALNVRYAISERSLPTSRFELVETFGSLRLYEFKRWQEQPFAVIEGSGDVTLESFEDEEIVVRAADGAHGRLRLNVSDFPRWTATRDGEPIEIEPVQVADDEQTGFMSVELAPGTYRFEFKRSFVDWLSLVLFMLGLGASLLLLLVDYSRPERMQALRARLDGLQAKLDTFCETHDHTLNTAFVTGLALVGVVAIGLALWTPPLDPADTDHEDTDQEVGEVHYDFGEHLIDATVGTSSGGNFKACEQIFDHFVCRKHRWSRVEQRAMNIRPGEMQRCIWAHPIDGVSLVLSYPDVPAGGSIVGWYAVADSGSTNPSSPVRINVGVDGITAGDFEVTTSGERSNFAVPLEASGTTQEITFEIDAPKAGKHHFCFSAQVVEAPAPDTR